MVAAEIDEATLEPRVSYRCADTGLTWSRTLRSWNQLVEVADAGGAKLVPRFQLLDAPALLTQPTGAIVAPGNVAA